MTRRSSLRAQAREIYCDLAAKKAAEATPTPDPPSLCSGEAGPPSQCYGGASPSPQGGGEPSLTAPSLTEKVRALYEESAVPVREIAAIAGVTERTIYKYAARQRWRKRYRRPDYAPLKGAGARFIRREDKDKPFAHGLKATDPASAARAIGACGAAEVLSRQALAEAERTRRFEARSRAMEANNHALGEYRRWREQRAKERASEHAKACAKWRAQRGAKPALPKPPWPEPSPQDLVMEDLYMRLATAVLLRWQALAKEEGAAITVAAQSENPAPVRARQR